MAHTVFARSWKTLRRTYTRLLTVKLRGRATAPDWSRGCTLSSRTRGDTTDSHGPLQRLLGAAEATRLLTWKADIYVASVLEGMHRGANHFVRGKSRAVYHNRVAEWHMRCAQPLTHILTGDDLR